MMTIPTQPANLQFLNRMVLAFVALSVSCTFAPATSFGFQQEHSNQLRSPDSTPSTFNRIPFRRVDRPVPSSRTSTPAVAHQQITQLTGFSQPVPTQPQPDPAKFSRQQPSSQPQPGSIQDDDIVNVGSPVVVFIDDIHLPAKESGVIKTLNVKEGEFIPAGKLIGRIDDEIILLALQRTQEQYAIAKIAADDDISIQAAELKYEVRKDEADRTKRLGKLNSKTKIEVRIAIFQEEIAKLEIAKSHQEKEKAMREVNLAEAQINEVKAKLRRHDLKVDFDAYIVEIFKRQHEYVNPGDDVARIARMDRLWVQGTVSNLRINPHEVLNRPVVVRLELARGEIVKFEGKIVTIPLERQTSDSFLVKAEIINRRDEGRWILQPNSECEMSIMLKDNNAGQGSAFQGGSFQGDK